MITKQTWIVRLGPQEWARYTFARGAPDGMTFLGSVQRGPGVGALAVLDDGKYVQVNGDFVASLNGKQIRRALAQAKTFQARPGRPPVSDPIAAPVVLVKRRRSLVPT